MSDGLHTQECLEYAAKTRKAFCIASCGAARRARSLSPPSFVKPGTVGQLRAALVGAPDDLEVVIRATEECVDGDIDVCVGLLNAGVELTCGGDDTPFFAIDGACIVDEEPTPEPAAPPTNETYEQMKRGIGPDGARGIQKL